MLDISVLEILGHEPVTLQEAKQYCRIDSDYEGDDALITDLISSARSAIEMWANISIVEKRIQVFSDTDRTLWLPRSPVIQIENIEDVDGTPIEFNNSIRNKVKVHHSGGYYVTYRAGFDPLPPDIKMAVLKQVSTDYDNRENFVINSNSMQLTGIDLSNSAKNLVQPYSRNLWL